MSFCALPIELPEIRRPSPRRGAMMGFARRGMAFRGGMGSRAKGADGRGEGDRRVRDGRGESGRRRGTNASSAKGERGRRNGRGRAQQLSWRQKDRKFVCEKKFGSTWCVIASSLTRKERPSGVQPPTSGGQDSTRFESFVRKGATRFCASPSGAASIVDDRRRRGGARLSSTDILSLGERPARVGGVRARGFRRRVVVARARDRDGRGVRARCQLRAKRFTRESAIGV